MFANPGLTLRTGVQTQLAACVADYVGKPYADLTSIFFSGLMASGFLGSLTLRIPFLKLASILSVSTPSGTAKWRSKEPKRRSWRW